MVGVSLTHENGVAVCRERRSSSVTVFAQTLWRHWRVSYIFQSVLKLIVVCAIVRPNVLGALELVVITTLWVRCRLPWIVIVFPEDGYCVERIPLSNTG